MKQVVIERVQSLQKLLEKEKLQAIIIPSSDPHLSEYIAPYWKSREWISGFTGSAGTIVITLNDAGLWTDSRYFIQAAQQLKDTHIQLYKESLSETPSITTYLCKKLQPGEKVGIYGEVFSIEKVEEIQANLSLKNILVKNCPDLINKLWINRPSIPQGQAFLYDFKFAGKDYCEKVSTIRQELKKENAQAILLSSLDEIAWTLNLRGNDIQCSPVVISYLLIEEESVHYFIQNNKITPEVKQYLKGNGVTLHAYEEIKDFLQRTKIKRLLLNPTQTNYAIYTSIHPSCQIIRGNSPVTSLKSIRNKQEITGIHTAMIKDGVAMVKFLKWLEANIYTGKETEISVSQKLKDFRSQQALYIGESFPTIAGYREHAAIVHYEANPESDIPLLTKGFLLLDSGAQYLDGTTDITRTIALGELTEEEKRDYTLVLKGHIALSMAQFPIGTRGTQLDALARTPLWKQGMNYLHGTGHGVGHFLNVHEGPQSIRMNENPIVLQPGMVISNEPGVYKAGSHGIRTENLILVIPAGEGMYGDYLTFETLTLCPICKKGILKELLTADEIEWLNEYHQTVYQKISPHLNKEEEKWLKAATSKF